MNDRAGDIPRELLLELETLRPLIEQQGIVQQHHGDDRSQRYRLRYREFDLDAGFTRHRSIPLGSNPVIIQAVAELIRQWKDEHLAGQKADNEQQPPEPDATPDEAVDPARELAQELCGGGRRRREQIAAWYDGALNDPVEMLNFNMTGAFPDVRKGGRPLKHRTW